MTAVVRALTDVDRVVSGTVLRQTREWIADCAELLADWTCAERVLAVVAQLVGDAAGGVVADALLAALREVDTVDLALDLLSDAGVPCA